MLRILLGLFVLASCSTGTVTSGGDKNYTYDVTKDYSPHELKAMAPDIITTLKRDPPVGTLAQVFGKGQKPLKRIGIIIFESTIQPTRDGLAGEDKVYLSEAGKQLITERLLNVWEESFPLVVTSADFVKTSKVKKNAASKKYGLDTDDYIKTERTTLAPDDIFFREKGKKTTSVTVVNPRGMRDLSLVMVPATELMKGPKWSEHGKHYVNEVMKELKLDAALIVMSELSWRAGHMEKRSGEHIAEEIRVKINVGTLISLSEYQRRLEKLKMRSAPAVTVNFSTYEGRLQFPAAVTVPIQDQNFGTIENNILNPLFKAYRDLTLMTLMNIEQDLKKTQE